MAAFKHLYGTNPAKCIKVYKNGDDYFTGVEVRVGERSFRTLDSVLEHVTARTKSVQRVKELRTLSGRKLVYSMEDIQHNGKYVAVTTGRFRPLHLDKLKETDFRSQSKRAGASPADFNIQAHKRTLPHSGLHKKIQTQGFTIIVYANGDVIQKPASILIPQRMLQQSLDNILDNISRTLRLKDGCVRKLVDYESKKVVLHPSQLQKKKVYIAVGNHKEFKDLDYTNERPRLDTSTRVGPMNIKPLPGIKRKRGSKNHSRSSSMNDSTNSNVSGEKNKSVSPRRPLPPIQKQQPQPHPPAEKKEDVFHARSVKHRRSSEKTREVNYDEDKSGLFKSKQQSTVTRGATEVEETLDTKVDLPIDQVEAEEVKDENVITEEEREIPEEKILNKTPSDNNQEANSDGADYKDKALPADDKQDNSYHSNRELEESENEKETKEREKEEENEEDIEKQTAAATTIQASFRGYKDRKRVSELKEGASYNNNNNDNVDRSDIYGEDDTPRQDQADQSDAAVQEENTETETEAVIKDRSGSRSYEDREDEEELKRDDQDVDKVDGRDTYVKETSEDEREEAAGQNHDIIEGEANKQDETGNHDNEQAEQTTASDHEDELNSSTYRVDDVQEDNIEKDNEAGNHDNKQAEQTTASDHEDELTSSTYKVDDVQEDNIEKDNNPTIPEEISQEQNPEAVSLTENGTNTTQTKAEPEDAGVKVQEFPQSETQELENKTADDSLNSPSKDEGVASPQDKPDRKDSANQTDSDTNRSDQTEGNNNNNNLTDRSDYHDNDNVTDRSDYNNGGVTDRSEYNKDGDAQNES